MLRDGSAGPSTVTMSDAVAVHWRCHIASSGLKSHGTFDQGYPDMVMSYSLLITMNGDDNNIWCDLATYEDIYGPKSLLT